MLVHRHEKNMRGSTFPISSDRGGKKGAHASVRTTASHSCRGGEKKGNDSSVSSSGGKKKKRGAVSVPIGHLQKKKKRTALSAQEMREERGAGR